MIIFLYSFNKLENSFPAESFSVEKSLHIMRNYQCNSCINILPWFKEFLSKMSNEFIIKIITNGAPQQQLNKINSINFIKLIFLNAAISGTKESFVIPG